MCVYLLQFNIAAIMSHCGKTPKEILGLFGSIFIYIKTHKVIMVFNIYGSGQIEYR